MTVPLDKPLKRTLQVGDDAYTLTISAEGLRLVPKGHRKGIELGWRDLVSGDAALAVALNASLDRAGLGVSEPAQPVQPARRRRGR